MRNHDPQNAALNVYEEETEMKLYCKYCGKELRNGASFCAGCGRAMDMVDRPVPPKKKKADPLKQRQRNRSGEPFPASRPVPPQAPASRPQASPAQSPPQASPAQSPPPQAPAARPAGRRNPRRRKSRGRIVLAGVCVLIPLLILGFFLYPRPLTLNSDETLEIYKGETREVSIEGFGISREDARDAVWTSDDEEVMTVEYGMVTGTGVPAETNNAHTEPDLDNAACTTTLSAEIKKGLMRWKGEIPVRVSLRPVDFENGEEIRSSDSDVRECELIGSDKYNIYAQLKSLTDSDHDVSVIIARGQRVTVDAAADEYELYHAYGNTWYGWEDLFGPRTEYRRTEGTINLRNNNYQFEFDVTDGNIKSDDIVKSDFPD